MDPQPTESALAGLEQTRRARGLVSDPVSGARVSVHRTPPPADLAGLVETLWEGSWDLPDEAPHTTELLADPSVNVVFEAGEGRIVGVWTRLWTRTLAGTGRVRAAKLRPGAARAVLGCEAHTLRDRVVPLDEPALVAAVLGEGGVEALADWVRGRAHADDRSRLAIALVEEIRCSDVTRADALAERAGLSLRALQRLFRTEVGGSPKWVIRQTRLQEVAARIEAGAYLHLADLACSLAYADQAHLSRDFRAATGKTLQHFSRLVAERGGPSS